MAEHVTGLYEHSPPDLSGGETVVTEAASSEVRLAGGDAWRVTSRRLTGGVSEGVDVVALDNGQLTVLVLPTRGMGVWQAHCDDVRLGWDSPVRRPVHPQHVELTSRNGLGWLDGFNELIVRCGLSFNGPPGIDEDAKSPVESQLTLHGRIANIPAHSVEVVLDDSSEPGTIGVRGIVEEATLFGPQLRMTSTISTECGSSSFTVSDEITNLGSGTTELQLLYHTNIGAPLLGPGAMIHCASSAVAPRDARAADGMDSYATYLGPTSGYDEQVYFYDLIPDAHNETFALLRDAEGELGVSLHFDRDQLPCFTLWKCTQPEADGYVTGLEPATNYPNFKAFEREQGRVVSLGPGETYRAGLRLQVHTSMKAITALQERISALQIRSVPEIHQRPTLPFSPVD